VAGTGAGAGAGAGVSATRTAGDAGLSRDDEHATKNGIANIYIPIITAISFGDFLIIEPSLIRCLAKFSTCNMYRRHTLRFCSIGEINLSEIRIPGAKGHR